ncbi:MAG: hypothetical protein UT42_C0006G0004 [Candidatus Falkowbacteria bacterium GW2011_GWA2_39_24]|uniref:Endonuclease GajA/Old nuclease/RecF-like AAA domain-containing protein n=1 Tax=Candidatus Falkowbacteria bacterium GW2011_GWA2_39_24 TaxID=1618634 RepID=A0A0G0RNT4_9BACT|nr:MAG: hypothetical protein UT42_C0006G0004 [Candidatus Falkowbacteria bacterium GW2011_GWA2_39_24]
MKYIKFEINKFKGIDRLELDLAKYPSGKIFPLVGLNESGKTTILEAIDFFQKDFIQNKRHELIHKRDKGSFTGDIETIATLELETEDQSIIKTFLEQNSLVLENEVKKIIISKKYNYSDGNSNNLTTITTSFEPLLQVKTAEAESYSSLNETLSEQLKTNLQKVVPKILYFPDFLFDFPEKIYLETVPNSTWSDKEKIRQEEYKEILQDILYTINPTYKLENFVAKLKATVDDGKQESASQIKREIGTKLNETIVDPWQSIFPNSPRKTIEIVTGNDVNTFYLQIKINEGASSFYINERSLGFKWFFGFLLSTEFRKARQTESGEYLFLFDEPANNLHQSSQQKLLALFENLTDKAKIIYSTHSHYLLSSKFILNTFIVIDEGRTTGDEYDYRQNIKAIPYAQFVAKYPDQENHFKPILDVLEFVENPFMPSGKIIFTEGKFDYYTFKLIEEKFFKDKSFDFNFYPGGGVDNYEKVFREYLANNRKFIAVFDADGDSDNGGIGAKKKYIDIISQELDKNIFVLSDIDITFRDFQTENLFTDIEKLEIQKKTFPSSTVYKKSEFNTAIQELFINKNTFEVSTETIERFKKIFIFVKQKFSDLS